MTVLAPSAGEAGVDLPGSRPRPGRSRATGLLLVALVGAGAVLRLWHLGASRLNYDESFTAMAGRRPLGGLVAFLTAHDSHPPLDYLIHLPLARAGVSEFWFRMPSVVCSIGAVALLAWWLRDRPRVAIVATALMAFAPFQLAHGREARMYAELELIGVAIAFVADRWLRAPRRGHSVALGGLVLAGLLTHVSMFLLAAGLLALAGRRRDAAAWQWRGAVGAALVGWALVWAPAFVVQAQGGHSAWIPHTTPGRLVHALGAAVTSATALMGLALVAALVGCALLVRQHDRLGRVVVCLYLVPVALGALAGLAAPVVIDRTFTLMAWAPIVAIAAVVAELSRRRAAAGAVVAILAVGAVALGAPAVVDAHTGPDTPLRVIAAHLRAGDVVAVRPASKAPELQWSVGVRKFPDSQSVRLPGARSTFALRLGDAPASGRLWLLEWHRYPATPGQDPTLCHHVVAWRTTSIRCIATSASRIETASGHPAGTADRGPATKA
ncbi:MAG: glycosyltransferase family 39 protein [Acidimicrobiia bacterium]